MSEFLRRRRRPRHPHGGGGGPPVLFTDTFEDGTYAKWGMVTPAEATPIAGAARLGSAHTQAITAASIITARPASGALRLAWDWRIPEGALTTDETLLVQFLNDWDMLAFLTIVNLVPTLKITPKDGTSYISTPLDLTLVEMADGATHVWAIDYDDSATPTVVTVRRDGVALASVDDATDYGEGIEQFWWVAGIGLAQPSTPGVYHDVPTVTLYGGIPGG
jgi:hypothetical protein